MLEKIDLKQKLKKDDYNEQLDFLGNRLGELQRDCRVAGIPIIIVFEGWRGAYRSIIINRMMQQMDARGFKVHATSKLTEDDKQQPFFTYLWQHLPAKGSIVVYQRSWYFLKSEQLSGFKKDDNWPITTYEHINAFEKQLTDDNYVLLKFFVHISQKKQKDNLAKVEKTFGKHWKNIGVEDDESKDYDKYLDVYEKMLRETDKNNAPWYLIAGEDLRFAEIAIFEVIVKQLEQALAAAEEHKHKKADVKSVRTEIYDVLSKVDLSKEIAKREYKEKLDKYQEQLRILQFDIYKKGIPTIIGFEGWDAAGKGGAIRRLTASFDPLGYDVTPVAAPNIIEQQFHYMWRFWTHLPKRGEISIFDRTWYGRVLVERVEKFASDAEWERAYAEINETESQWAEYGVAIAKFWLQIDQEEQYKRFKEREVNQGKIWKITEDDWRNREKWSEYEAAVNEMLVRTSTDYAPWTIIEGNSKYYARLKVLKTVIEMFEKRLDSK